MRVVFFAAIAAFAASPHARAQAAQTLPARAAELCRDAIATADAGRVPRPLLRAIADVESGRPDPDTGAVNPWPWTINVEGQGYMFDTREKAIAAVRALLQRNIHSIDIGCMQINLMHHPSAFGSLEEGFDPAINVRYAVHFLDSLFAQTGNWADAAALYHSATPEIAAPYRRKVLVLWTGNPRLGLPDTPQARLAAAWAATTTTSSSTENSFSPPGLSARSTRHSTVRPLARRHPRQR